VSKAEVPKATQPAEVGGNGADEVGVGEVEHGEEGKISKVRGERAMERHAGQLQGGDAMVAPATRHADPTAEGHVGGPAVVEDAKRVGELGLEREQRGEVSVIVARKGRSSEHSR
jgi:hypothetical protein